MHGVLYLAPGAVAAFFGLVILARARSVTRGSVGFAGLIVAACGAWFVVGPALWPTFGTGPVFTPASTAMDSFINQVGYNLGVGVVLAVLGGMALKALARDREVPVEGRRPSEEGMRDDAIPPEGETAAGAPYAGDRAAVDATHRQPYGDRGAAAGPAGGAGSAWRTEPDRTVESGRRAEPTRGAAVEPMGGDAVPRDRVGGDHVGGERVADDRVGGDHVGGERVADDRVGGNRVEGGRLEDGQVENEQLADPRVPVGGGPGNDRPAGDNGNERRGLRRLFSR
jgi:hypothetical protein